MIGVLLYKGVAGSIERSEEDDCYCGQILGAADLVLYNGKTFEQLREDFEFMAQVHLDDCEMSGQAPPYAADFDINNYLAATA